MKEQIIRNVNTWCPLFEGFYETSYSGDSQIENLICEFEFDDRYTTEEKEKMIEEFYNTNHFEANFENWKKDVCLEHIKHCEKALNDIFKCDVKIQFELLYSPKEYNVSNDSINCKIEIDLNEVREYLDDNIELWESDCCSECKSIDGFVSYYDADLLIECDIKDMEKDVFLLGHILEFIITNEIEYDINERVLENVNFNLDWDTINKELIAD